jgi:hypothetical protein
MLLSQVPGPPLRMPPPEQGDGLHDCGPFSQLPPLQRRAAPERV